ncbi:MAG: NADH:ubiquinone reductase (Na(+)-transporting) subunit C [Pontiellaceae bacterium]|nr:NADH:ubiquinone reductase (Na(+)-transporting) subunit C [Pontiellaceae bacterium]
MREETKTLTFAAVICVACSLLLSGTAAILKTRIASNEKFDEQRNIVKAFGINVADKNAWPREKIEAAFQNNVTKIKIDGGLPLYTWTEDGADAPSKYAFPISGKGLWSILYGYVAVEADLETIAGITFYKHEETPGLGAEIEKAYFQDQFVGKKLYEAGLPTEFTVVKPGMAQSNIEVDGISGATLTSQGVQNLLRKDAAAYADYFKTLREN